LGDVVHLIQDMAQPQHVRNDEHLDHIPFTSIPFNPSVYERFIECAVNPNFPFCFALNVLDPITRGHLVQSIGQAVQTTYNVLPVFSRPEDFFGNGLGFGLAEFTNRSFVSSGTNFTSLLNGNTDGVHPSPRLDLSQKEDVPIQVLNPAIPNP